MPVLRADLEALGFTGFVPFVGLPTSSVPEAPGVYAVVRTTASKPAFRSVSPAGRFKGRDPSTATDALLAKWVQGAEVLYIGKATGGIGGRRGLRKRLDEYRRHGAGDAVGHWGGRYVWQLEDSDQLLVAWLETLARDPGEVESELITAFRSGTGSLPFANLNGGRRLPATR